MEQHHYTISEKAGLWYVRDSFLVTAGQAARIVAIAHSVGQARVIAEALAEYYAGNPHRQPERAHGTA